MKNYANGKAKNQQQFNIKINGTRGYPFIVPIGWR